MKRADSVLSPTPTNPKSKTNETQKTRFQFHFPMFMHTSNPAVIMNNINFIFWCRNLFIFYFNI